MTNLDTKNQKKQAILQKMTDAVKANDSAAFSEAFDELAENIESNILAEYKEMQAQQDKNILQARGAHVLTNEENKYYSAIIDAMKSADPKSALANANVTIPETVINSVFDDLQKEHPLLAAINFQNTEGAVKMLLSTTGGVAAWGALGATVSSELTASFVEVDMLANQLTAYIPVAKYMLELGPTWMDSYVRQLLAEALATQFEVGIVDGTGKDQPIGMDRALTGAVDGVYPQKDAIAITDLSPTTIGTICDDVATDASGKKRAVNKLVMIVNPSDYFTKVFPATTPRAADGTFSHDVLPFPIDVIQSAAVGSGKAIFGLANKYFLGCGTGSGSGKLEYSDDVKFLERQRVYLTYLYANGRATDAHAFYYADISGLTAYTPEVVVNEVKGTVKTKEQA